MSLVSNLAIYLLKISRLATFIQACCIYSDAKYILQTKLLPSNMYDDKLHVLA